MDMTLKQAVEHSKKFPRPISYSYLVRAVRAGKIPATKVELPTGGSYWTVKQSDLDAYLASERKPGRKKQEHPEPEPDGDPGPEMPVLLDIPAAGEAASHA